MISKDMCVKINKLINHFEILASEYRSMGLILYTNDSIFLNGFARCLRHESKERWQISEKICKFMKDNSGKVVIESIPKPESNYGSVNDMFARAEKMEERTCSSVCSLISDAEKLNDYITRNFLEEILKKCIREHKEIKEIKEMFNTSESDKSILFMIDEKLYNEYDPYKYYKKYCDKYSK